MVVEIGGYLGYTTRFLAENFRVVVSIEAIPHFVAAARRVLTSHGNAAVLQLNTLQDDWTPVVSRAQAAGGANVVLVDGDHTYETVLNDLELAVFGGLGPTHRGRRPQYVALDDYFVRAEVAQAV